MSINLEKINLLQPAIYSPRNSPVSVYKAHIQGQSNMCVVKILRIRNQEDKKKHLLEAQVMYNFDHPNLMKVTGYFERSDRKEVWIVMDFCERGDLASEIIRRHPNNFWTEEELWNIFKQIIDACAYLQRQAFAHRDIKPRNIFLGNDGYYKLADFGAVKKNEHFIQGIEADNMTLQGTVPYLSPLLRKLYAMYQRNPSKRHIEHNAVKSDVYSLGITFVCMIFLREPTNLATINNLDREINEHLKEINYPRIRELIASMLIIEEEQRPNFTQLYATFFQEETIDCTNLVAFLEAIENQDLEKAEKFVTKAIRRNADLDLKIVASKVQLENLLSSIELNVHTMKVVHTICNDMRRPIYVDASRACIQCKKQCREINFSCCNFYMHTQCILECLKSDVLAEEIACSRCRQTNLLCCYCGNYGPDSELLNCGLHRACAKCSFSNNRQCLHCLGTMLTPITRYHFSVYLLFRFCPNENCDYKEFVESKTKCFECNKCRNYYCTVCKGNFHPDSCLSHQM